MQAATQKGLCLWRVAGLATADVYPYGVPYLHCIVQQAIISWRVLALKIHIDVRGSGTEYVAIGLAHSLGVLSATCGQAGE